ncbi:hypothetical protein BH18THE2_BH18THE2_25130 [soil metagenome]
MNRTKILLLTEIEEVIANKEWTINKQILNDYLKVFGINENLYND